MKNQKFIIFLICLFVSLSSFSQIKKDDKKDDKKDSKTIIIKHSVSLEANENLMPNIQILKGDVELEHDTAVMFCDSAYFNKKANNFRAWGNIHIIKPTSEKDTVHLYGDSLMYDGKKKIAKVRGKVKLKKDSLLLTTKHLDFDMNDAVGHYFDNGRTENGRDTLLSVFGYYYSRKDLLFFKKDVIVLNPKYKINSDTLKHNTVKKISYFFGPTTIISDSNYIYCENGWYNHKSDVAQFNKNSLLKSKQHTLKGDSVYYDRKSGLGKAFINVEITDTAQNIRLRGNDGKYWEKTQRSFMTDKAVFMQFNEKDTLYMHADTIFSKIDTLKFGKKDSLKYRIVKAYRHAKVYKSDLQAKCDSLVYTFKDSTIEFHYEPVLWSKEHQLTAKFMRVKTKKSKVDRIFLEKSSFIISQSDSIRFDQIKGTDMFGYVKDNKLYQVDVVGNCETIYFAKDKEDLIGVNKIECARIKILLDKGKVEQIWFFSQPKGGLYPPAHFSQEELKLKDFKWFTEFRPLNKDEIFIWKKDK